MKRYLYKVFNNKMSGVVWVGILSSAVLSALLLVIIIMYALRAVFFTDAEVTMTFSRKRGGEHKEVGVIDKANYIIDFYKKLNSRQ